MTLYQFNALDEMEQIEAIWNKGVLLAQRKDEKYEYTLYQIDSFYIELRNDPGDMGYNGMKTFSTTTLLEPYLGQIDLGGVGE